MSMFYYVRINSIHEHTNNSSMSEKLGNLADADGDGVVTQKEKMSALLSFFIGLAYGIRPTTNLDQLYATYTVCVEHKIAVQAGYSLGYVITPIVTLIAGLIFGTNVL